MQGPDHGRQDSADTAVLQQRAQRTCSNRPLAGMATESKTISREDANHAKEDFHHPLRLRLGDSETRKGRRECGGICNSGVPELKIPPRFPGGIRRGGRGSPDCGIASSSSLNFSRKGCGNFRCGTPQLKCPQHLIFFSVSPCSRAKRVVVDFFVNFGFA